jgi:exopolyphosphatase/guanosine-5'-triphosphate,3'-diphosphate pyrophosphatase
MLSDKELHNAEVLGKALRFGAMIAVDAPDEIAQLQYYPKKKELILTLRPDAEDLFGEVAEARFMSLASALGAAAQIKHAKLKKA